MYPLVKLGQFISVCQAKRPNFIDILNNHSIRGYLSRNNPRFVCDGWDSRKLQTFWWESTRNDPTCYLVKKQELFFTQKKESCSSVRLEANSRICILLLTSQMILYCFHSFLLAPSSSLLKKNTFFLGFSFIDKLGFVFESCRSSLPIGGFWTLQFLCCRNLEDKRRSWELSCFVLKRAEHMFGMSVDHKPGPRLSSFKIGG